jgi:hypothetical protein
VRLRGIERQREGGGELRYSYGLQGGFNGQRDGQWRHHCGEDGRDVTVV